MRNFSYITVGKMLNMLQGEGVRISRQTFNKLESEGLFSSERISIGGWRVYTPVEANLIVKLIKENYGIGSK